MDAYEFDNADQSAKFIEVGETQNRNLITAFNCKGDDKDIIKHKVSKDFNNFASSGRIGSLFFDITNTTSGKEFIKSVQIFNTNSAGVRTTQMSQAIVSKDQKHIEVPCAAVKQGDIILIEILRMDDREGDYTLSLSESPQPKVIPDATVCIGTTLQVVNLPGSASVDWLSSVYNLSNLNGPTTRILSTKANSGIVFTNIKDQGCTVTLKNVVKVANVPDPVIKKVEKINSILTCIGYVINFKAQITGATNVKWKLTSGPGAGFNVSNITDSTATASANFITYNGKAGTYIQIEIIATNACGVSITYTNYYDIYKPLCNETGGSGGSDIIEVTPNPTRGVTTIKMIPKQELETSIERTVRIYSPITGVQFEQKTSEAQLEIDVSELLDGLYYVQVSREGSISQAVLVVQKD